MNRVIEQRISMRRIFFASLAVLFGAALAASGALWWKYGTAVFFESIRSRLAACFGGAREKADPVENPRASGCVSCGLAHADRGAFHGDAAAGDAALLRRPGGSAFPP